MSEIDDLKARLARLEPLEKAQQRHAAALEAHRANVEDPAAKAEYRAASDELAALRQKMREEDLAAGTRPQPGEGGDGVAAPDTITTTVDLPQPGGAA